MNADRTAREALDTVIDGVQGWIDHGICQNCAIRVAAKCLNIDSNTVETVWIDHQVQLLESETALD